MQDENRRSLLVVCGETSGEAHAAGVVKHLRTLSPGCDWQVFGSGGEKLRESGAEIMLDVSRLSAIGPWAALGNLGNYLSLRKRILARVRQAKPDLALLVERHWRAVDNARRQYLDMDGAVVLAREVQRLRAAGLREGTSTTLELIDAQTNLTKVQTERAQAANDYVQALAQLLESAGLSDQFSAYIARADIRVPAPDTPAQK